MASALRETQPTDSWHHAREIASALAQPTRQSMHLLGSPRTKQPQPERTLSTSLGDKTATSSKFFSASYFQCLLVPVLPSQLREAFAESKPPRQTGAQESGGKPPHSKWAAPSAELSGTGLSTEPFQIQKR